jgi:hypothetical protein
MAQLPGSDPLAYDASRFAADSIETFPAGTQNCRVHESGIVVLDEVDLDLLDMLQHDAGRTLR